MRKENYSKEAYERRLAYNKEYNKRHVTPIRFDLNNTKDADILAFLNNKDNKSGYIKDLIRKDMNNGN